MWTTAEKLTLACVIVGLIAAVAGLMVVPEIRAIFGLTTQSNSAGTIVPVQPSAPTASPAPQQEPRAGANRASTVSPKSVKKTGSESAASGGHMEEIITFLNQERIRATYGAVAEVLHVKPVSMGTLLGPRNKAASWVVNATTGLPTGYSEQDIDPALLEKKEIIRTGQELEQRLAQWKRAH